MYKSCNVANTLMCYPFGGSEALVLSSEVLVFTMLRPCALSLFPGIIIMYIMCVPASDKEQMPPAAHV